MKRIRIDLKALSWRCLCPWCGLPVWLSDELGLLHRLPTCRRFDTLADRPERLAQRFAGRAP